MTPWQRERLMGAIARCVARPRAWHPVLDALCRAEPAAVDVDALRAAFADEAARTLVTVVEEVLFEAATEHVVVTGVPRAGKTTFAAQFDPADAPMDPADAPQGPVLHTDDLIGACGDDRVVLDWSGVSKYVAEHWLGEEWFGGLRRTIARPVPFRMVEGVAAVRALRKWLAAHPEGKPCDRVLWFGEPRVALTPGQAALAKGCRTVWAEVEPELRRRGVEIEVRS